jgi:hypothetical protein
VHVSVVISDMCVPIDCSACIVLCVMMSLVLLLCAVSVLFVVCWSPALQGAVLLVIIVGDVARVSSVMNVRRVSLGLVGSVIAGRGVCGVRIVSVGVCVWLVYPVVCMCVVLVRLPSELPLVSCW